MNPLFKKLNFKDHKEILILNAPESFQLQQKEMESFTQISTKLNKSKNYSFILAFVTKQKEIEELAPVFSIVLEGDGILWFAYPKGTSKKYKCDFNRDNGWDSIKKKGFESVRMVAIDEDWSALRLRRVEYIKALKRK